MLCFFTLILHLFFPLLSVSLPRVLFPTSPRLCSLTCFLSHMCSVSPCSSSELIIQALLLMQARKRAHLQPLLNQRGTLTSLSGGMCRKRALALSLASLQSNLGLTYDVGTSSLVKSFQMLLKVIRVF